MRWTVPARIALCLLLGVPERVGAQPCGEYRDVSLGAPRVHAIVDAFSREIALGDRARSPARERVAAYRRALDRIREVDQLFDLCDRVDPAEAAIAEAAGLDLYSPVLLRRAVVDRCVAIVRSAHLAGPDAELCLDALEDPYAQRARRFAPAPPARWATAADPSAEHAAMRRELRRRPSDELRLALARAELASADFAGALRTLGALAGYDAALLRALAVYAIAASFEGTLRLLEALRGLARETPRRPEAHAAIATLARGHAAVRDEDALEHARVAACLIEPPVEPELALAIVHFWRALGHEGPWGWDGAGTPPTLPLPPDRLGPDLPPSAARMPVAETCDAVLARHPEP